MQKVKKLNYRVEVIEEIINDILSSTPGVAIDYKPIIEISLKTPRIYVKYAPKPFLTNIYDLSVKIQDNIYHKIMGEFDLAKLIVDITAIKI